MPPASATRQRAARLLLQEGIARLALLALSERDVQRLLERAVARIAEALGVDYVQIFELLPDGNTLVLRATTNGDRKAPGRGRIERTKPAGSQASFTLHAGEPVVVGNLSKETRFQPSRIQRAVGVVTAVSVPLFGRGPRPYGVLEVGARSRPVVAPEEVADFLQGAGSLLVCAVERARLEAACRFLAESETRLVSTRNFRDSVVALAEVAVPRLADWCCIDVVLPRGTIEPIALAHADPEAGRVAKELRDRVLPDPDAEVGIARVLRTGSTEFHFDLGAALSVRPEQEDAVAELADTAGFRAAIVAPLAARGHVFGAVTLVARRARRLFDEGDVLLADAFAAHAALALDNVRLFFGKRADVPALPRLAGVTNGITLLDSELLGSRLLDAVAEEKIRLTRVVDSIVLASRLGSEERDYALDTSDIADVVRSAVDGIRPSLSPSLRLELEQPSVLAAGDPATVRRIVTCLVENAVAYSHEGGSVRVRLEAGKTTMRLSVSDEGIGIPPEERERVFDKFFRGEVARSVGVGGVGLGLYICRELVSRLNGSVDLVARERGTTLVVELPLASLPPAQAAAELPAPPPERKPERSPARE